MASYTELFDLRKDDALRNRVVVAITISADTMLSGTPSVDELKWAAAVFSNPESIGKSAFRGVLAANNNATVAQITGAGDAAIQSVVDALVPNLVIAFNAT